jgi:metal-responsive CopG/Arc/MetJ family transcriptional regulator
MNAKKIATSLPGDQYVALERVRKRLQLKRSEAVQQALALWLAAREGDDRVAQYVRGYAEQPDDPREARAMVDAWAEGLAAEDW